MDRYNFRAEVVEQTCTRCGNKFTRHRESSEVFVCLPCYEDNIVKVRTRKDTITFILKMVLAVFLIIWAFFVYTNSKAGSKSAKLSGLVEAMASAGLGLYIGKNAFKKYNKTKRTKPFYTHKYYREKNSNVPQTKRDRKYSK